eukprot:6197267-Pleurochrysis_carterae.AAC.5
MTKYITSGPVAFVRHQRGYRPSHWQVISSRLAVVTIIALTRASTHHAYAMMLITVYTARVLVRIIFEDRAYIHTRKTRNNREVAKLSVSILPLISEYRLLSNL